MAGTVTQFIASYNTLQEQAKQRSPKFVDNLCEFIVDEFKLDSAIVFKVVHNEKLQLLGKSSGAKKSLEVNSEHPCTLCRQLNNELKLHEFHQDKNGSFQSTDYLYNEGSVFIDTLKNTKYMLRVSSKSAFTKDDVANIEAGSKLIAGLLENWSGENIGAKSTFSKLVTEISNELRTPTNSIVGFASLLNDDKLNSSQEEYVTSLKENAQKLLGLINDLVDIAKIDSELVSPQQNEVNLEKLIGDVAKLFTDNSDPNTLSFDINIGAGLTGNLKLDQQKLRLVMLNLISFMLQDTARGVVTINAAKVDGKLKITLANSQTVIPENLLKDFFTPYTLVDASHQKFLINTVLGLILTKKYILLQNGDIDISSSPDRGTVCHLTIGLPGAEAPAKQEGSSAGDLEAKISALPKAEGKHNRVLVIEDDYATSKLLSNYLHKWGYEPTIINSGMQALELLEKERFLAIITDIVLPDVNGLELLKKIRENKKTQHTPIIVCSVEAEQQKAFMMGAVEYFVKPISYKDLVEVLTSYKLKKDSNVLCVDDDVPTLNLVKDAIESVGFNPIAENDSTKVMDRIMGKDLDLAIIDLDMPGLNGFELIKLIKSEEQFANLPVVIYTGKENYEEDLAKIDGLFSDLLSKRSTKIEDLADTINKMVNRYEEPTPPEEAAKKQADGIPNIMLVEDYKHSQIIVTRLLKKNNFTSVVVKENGAEAVEQAREQHFDLILMDMQMPVMNGFEATERIRQMPEYKETPIIALTAFAMKGDREKCLDAGATDYIPKPIDSQEFIEKVKYYTSK